ncbi:MAG TPA: hypothetical protein VFU81_16970 [Thermomicrobiales bacterium]|nr:hypothetical protein [Thermomicrobiales bacterium]
MGARSHDKDQSIDQAGERGGDTGPSSVRGDGPGAEKGDWRRDHPVHSGPTRHGSQGTDSEHGKRNGSESNASS